MTDVVVPEGCTPLTSDKITTLLGNPRILSLQWYRWDVPGTTNQDVHYTTDHGYSYNRRYFDAGLEQYVTRVTMLRTLEQLEQLLQEAT